MRNVRSRQIAVRLEFKDIADRRTYVRSPDLPGFHAVIEADEEPIEALREPLRLFLSRYLAVDIFEIEAALAPAGYRAQSVGVPLTEHVKPGLMLAAVA